MPEERVRLRAPLHEPALAEHDVELVDAVEVLGLGDEHEVGVAAGADEREALQEMVGAEVLARRRGTRACPRARWAASWRRQAGSTCRNVYLTK